VRSEKAWARHPTCAAVTGHWKGKKRFLNQDLLHFRRSVRLHGHGSEHKILYIMRDAQSELGTSPELIYIGTGCSSSRIMETWEPQLDASAARLQYCALLFPSSALWWPFFLIISWHL
jgi:hypothetical protein